jgi:hypothetical protein
MCTGAEIGLILAATGTGVGAINQQGAMRKQDRSAARGVREQAEFQRQANARMQQELAGLQQSGPQPEQAQSMDAYMNALRAAQPGVEAGFQAPGTVNPRFAELVSGQRQDMGGIAGGTARDMSVMDAAMLQRLREGQSQNRAVSDLGRIGGDAAGADYLNRLRTASIRPNPWVGAAGSIMQGVGSAMAMMPPKAAAAGAAAGAPTTAAAVSPAGMTQDMLARLRGLQNPFSNPGQITSVLGGP